MTKRVATQIKKIHDRRFHIRPPRVETVIAATCQKHNVSRTDLMSAARCMMPRVVRAREEVCVELRKWNWSYSRIGKSLGGLHHTTVRSALIRAGAAPLTGPVIRDCDFSVPDFSGEWAI